MMTQQKSGGSISTDWTLADRHVALCVLVEKEMPASTVRRVRGLGIRGTNAPSYAPLSQKNKKAKNCETCTTS